jgi:hypothetical protein
MGNPARETNVLLRGTETLLVHLSVSISLNVSPRVWLESYVLLHGTETIPVHLSLSPCLCRYLQRSSRSRMCCFMALNPASTPVSVSMSLQVSPRVWLEPDVLLHGTETLLVHLYLSPYLCRYISMSLIRD